MVWSGSAPRSGVRERVWAVLLVMGVAWLGLSWLVLRAEPSDVGNVAGPVLLFAAASEVVRALAGARTWWLGAALAVLFTVGGVVVWRGVDSSYATTAAVVGGFLMVRGVADVIVATLLRETDRIWGFLLVLGVAEAALGGWTAAPAARSAQTLIAVLAGLALARSVADLIGALQLWEGPRASLLELSPERAAGVAGFAAGLSAYPESIPQPPSRHRGVARGSAAGLSALSAPGGSGPGLAGLELAEPGPGWPTAAGPTGADPTGAASTSARPTGAASTGARPTAAGPTRDGLTGAGPTGAGPTGPGAPGSWSAGAEPPWPGQATAGPAAARQPGAGAAGTRATGTAPVGPAIDGGVTPVGGRPTSFHDEVLRTTADLDTMLAMAGVTGSATGVAAAAQQVEIPPVPDTPEGVLAMPGGQPPTGQWPPGAPHAEPPAAAPATGFPDAAWQRPPQAPAPPDPGWQRPPEAAWPPPSPAVQAPAVQAPPAQALETQALETQALEAQALETQAPAGQSPPAQAAAAQAPPAAPAHQPWPGGTQVSPATGTGDGTTGGGRRRAE
ncbi:uncharacterized membrane protein HdeD (DUF308 family) [Krasilnikovia cinnamomea]|uniref:Uncharacterized membrane protein HdeD (DUF308 family) n=1 Tax=Krasilnikovia cinnamomea TaxID=349313 RepID=A0A4Q7ZPM0_9ACTN|nr:hypothetical protein [Krasilnikovia cinnamomea]RZU53022.1 uncharacterized membrane protein HdeD (DUF308 family) [Krasilnikovia cinnamomea]